MKTDELRKYIKKQMINKAFGYDADFDAIEDFVVEEITKAVEELADRVTGVGHNDDCLFCGFKDKSVAEVMEYLRKK